MPEAVIVSDRPLPDRTRGQGLARDIRPDDLAAQMVRAALDKVPELDPTEIDDLMLGCGLPGGEQGYNMGRVVAVLPAATTCPAQPSTAYCSSSLQTTRMALHAIKAGEGDVFISAGVETGQPVRQGQSDSTARTPRTRVFADAKARTAERAGRRRAWADPREDGRSPTSTSPWVRPRRTSPQLTGITREEQDEFAVRSAEPGRAGDRRRAS